MPDLSPPSSEPTPATPDRRWWLVVAGSLAVLVCHPGLWFPGQPALWSPALGLALVLCAWRGFGILLPVAAAILLPRLVIPAPDIESQPLGAVVGALQVGLSWWAYRTLADGARRLDDPRSATIFLLLVPSLAGALCAVVLALASTGDDFLLRLINAWLCQGLGVMVLAPPLLAVGTPWAVYYGLALRDRADRSTIVHPRLTWTVGEVVEMVALALGAAIVAAALANLHARGSSANWHLWGILLLVIVWASLRLGLRGGSMTAAVAAIVGLTVGTILAEDLPALTPLRGNLFAQCCVALLVGASADWIRASEARYRQVVGHIPVVLYSARFLRRPVVGVRPEVEILLVSPAARTILGCDPDTLVGGYSAWLERIHPQDRELLQAALAQLLLQKQPVTCEYRLAAENPAADEGRTPVNPLQALTRTIAANHRWVRDTLAPRDNADGQLEGWEGVVEDITQHRQLAHDLRRTSNMLHALVSHLPTGIFFVHGVHGQPLLVNARARQLLGQREDLAAGLSHLSTVYRLHRPDGTPYPWDELPVYKALRHGVTTMRDDIVVYRPDGRKIPLVTWAAPVNLGTPAEPDAAVWVLEDLTALRQAEAARHETELRLRTLIETMAEGLVVQTHTGQIVECNRAACEILGCGPEELKTRDSLAGSAAMVHENGELVAREEQPDRLALRTGQPVRGQVFGLAVAGETRWILANAMLTSVTEKPGDNRGQRIVITFSDITGYRRAQAVLRHSEERYRGLVENLPLMVLQFDATGGLTYFNPATAEQTGYSAAELSQAGFWQQCVHPEDADLLRGLLEAAAAGNGGRAEVRYRSASGIEQAGYVLAQPHQPGGATLLVVDMTQRRRMEKEMQKVQRLELVGKLAGGVVHDFNNLLTVILSYADLARQALGDHPVAQDLEQITEAANHAARLAAQLLAFSKQRQVVLKCVDLNTAVAHVVKMLRPTLPFNIDIRLELDPGTLNVMADEPPLQQVLMNLCLNARDAMPEGGEIAVTTDVADLIAGDARVASAPAATGGVRRWARLTVQDTGIGMSEEIRARIFEPLFTTKERGSGLGLAVVKQIVEGFGGCVQVDSQPGVGSSFHVWLPLRVA